MRLWHHECVGYGNGSLHGGTPVCWAELRDGSSVWVHHADRAGARGNLYDGSTIDGAGLYPADGEGLRTGGFPGGRCACRHGGGFMFDYSDLERQPGRCEYGNHVYVSGAGDRQYCNLHPRACFDIDAICHGSHVSGHRHGLGACGANLHNSGKPFASGFRCNGENRRV